MFQNKKQGFTLVEILVSVAIFVLIVGALTMLSRNIWIYNSYIGIKLNNTNTIKQVLKTITTEVRTASSGSNGAHAIAQAEIDSFTFYADIYNNGIKEKIRYFLNGNSLQRGIIVPTGNPLVYNSGDEEITTIASDIVNNSIFEYYDNTYDGTSASLPHPIDTYAVRLIKITLEINPDINRPENLTTFSTQVALRNLKDNL